MTQDAAHLFLIGFDQLVLAYREFEGVPQPEGDRQGPEPGSIAEKLADTLDGILQAHANTPSDLPKDLLDEVNFGLAALVDELLLFQVEWSGRSVWFEHLMERRRYRTAAAGRRIFERIETLATRYHTSPHLPGAARFYLMMLHLGFVGELSARPEKIDAYKTTLAALATLPTKQGPNRVFGTERVCPEAYRHTHSPTTELRLSSMRRWWRWMFGCGLGYIALTTIFWIMILSYAHVLSDTTKVIGEVNPSIGERMPSTEREAGQ